MRCPNYNEEGESLEGGDYLTLTYDLYLLIHCLNVRQILLTGDDWWEHDVVIAKYLRDLVSPIVPELL